MKFLDLFAGIGGFRLGMEAAGHECVGYVEWDKYARKSYEAIHNTKGEWTAHDITTVTDDDIRHFRGTVQIICGGFPCQAFSVAGNRKGFEDTRGTMFFEIARFANVIRPRYLILENVKGLLNHDGGNTFRTILRTLHELGYDAEWELVNSKDFGVPQHRERVIIIGHLRGERTPKIFPIGRKNEKALRFVGLLDMKGNESIRRVYDPVDGICPTITTMQGGHREPKILVRACLTPDREKRQQGRRFKEDGEPAFTVNTIDRHGVAIKKDEWAIRKLTPRECWRLQGFPDWAFDKAAEVNSESQLYKQAGNAVTVNVIQTVANLIK